MDIFNTSKSTSEGTSKTYIIDAMRMKDIIAQLSDVIYLLCNAKSEDVITIFDQFTNITPEERISLNIKFPNDVDDE